MTSVASDRPPDRLPERRPERKLQLGWLDAVVRHRRLAYTGLAGLYVASFNGIWRVGVDSALYRGLGRSLARGDGYFFAGEHHQHAFAGVPWMLAAIERLTGSGSPVPGLAMITLMALATLWLVDRLVALRYPLWVATLVTLGMGVNFRFLRQSQELMTDVPFTLGVMSALYGLERLRLLPWRERWKVARAAGLLMFGLALAAATRPTFAVLAGAIVLGSLARAWLAHDGRRGLHLAIVAAALLVLLALFIADPRTVGISPMGGVYEQELVERVQDLPHTIAGQLAKFFGTNLNDAFFSQSMNPISVPMALVVLVGAGIVLRRDVVWGLMIFGLVAVTLPLSTVPRYYLMVMPLLWVGWLLLAARATLWTPAAVRGPVAFVLMLTPLAMNAGRDSGFVIEQRRPDWAMLTRGEDREANFYARYRGGLVLRQRATADMIRAHARPDQTVVGPTAHVLAYLADRRVVGSRELFAAKDVSTARLPVALERAAPGFAIFPSDEYDKNDVQLRDLIRKRVLVSIEDVASAGDARLATVRVRVPPSGENWRTYEPTPATTQASTRPTATKTTRPTSKPTTKPATKPSTKPATKPATKRAAATRPTTAPTTTRLSSTQKAERAAQRERQADRADDATQANKLQKQKKLERQRRIEKRERIAERERARRSAATTTSTTPTTAPAVP